MTQRCVARLKLNKSERKVVVDKFNVIAAKMDDLYDDECGMEDIVGELSYIWYNEFDLIAEVQVDPIRVTTVTDEIQILDKKALCEGELVRFTGKIVDDFGNSDELNALMPWKQLDILDPKTYGEVASLWNIRRPQDIQAHNEYWIPKKIHDS
jgi:hypothetical protein